jgi:xylan 1,4-beta-xylosidase
MESTMRRWILAGLLGGVAAAQVPVRISVDAATVVADYKPVWNYFGADEPNYTYAPGGAKLMAELGAISPSVPVYFRPHNLLTSGDGSGSLKWGSTGVYREDADGKAVYNWAITDKLFDNLVAAHVRPMVEVGFMPEALSPHPEPYRHSFKNNGGEVFTGWSYPPKDYTKWRALVVAYAAHLKQRYGAAVDTWQWEVWNEPDIPYFHGTPEEYLKLYDVTTGAIREVLPKAFVGGPGVTGGGENKHFLQLFLEHCARGVNADSGKTGAASLKTGAASLKTGAPLDFISFHPKGSPKFVDGHVVMNLGRQLALTDRGFQTVASFPEFRKTPIVLTESDPEGCAACQGPQNGYRNGPLYGVSVAEMLVRSAELARLRGVNLLGAVTWAFEMEDQPYFAGFRELATNGPEGILDKPVLNVFRMFGKLSGKLVSLSSTGEVPVETIAKTSVTAAPDVSGMAVRGARSLDVMLWNYHDEDVAAAPASVVLALRGLPNETIRQTKYVMDGAHSNAYAAWLKMGSPADPTAAQMAELRKVQGLEAMSSKSLPPARGHFEIETKLERQAVVLYHFSW